MVKGVHQNIIEITDTGSDCFERAILFVRPQQQGKDTHHLLGRARLYLSDIKLRRGVLGGRKSFLFTAVKFTAAAAVGAAAAVLLL